MMTPLSAALLLGSEKMVSVPLASPRADKGTVNDSERLDCSSSLILALVTKPFWALSSAPVSKYDDTEPQK